MIKLNTLFRYCLFLSVSILLSSCVAGLLRVSVGRVVVQTTARSFISSTARIARVAAARGTSSNILVGGLTAMALDASGQEIVVTDPEALNMMLGQLSIRQVPGKRPVLYEVQSNVSLAELEIKNGKIISLETGESIDIPSDVYFAHRYIGVRSYPASNASVVSNVEKGGMVVMLEKGEQWHIVKHTKDGKEVRGFVAASAISPLREVEGGIGGSVIQPFNDSPIKEYTRTDEYDCAEARTGNAMFHNKTNMRMAVVVVSAYVPSDWVGLPGYIRPEKHLSLAPGESKELYNLKSDIYEYAANYNRNAIPYSIGGQFRIKTCEDTNVNIRL